MRLTDDRFHLSPSDLNDFVECRHLTQLNSAVQRGELQIEPTSSVEAKLLSRKGDEHEREYLEQLRTEGRDVFEAPSVDWGSESGPEEAAAATEQAIREGREVIYQACFVDGAWRGFADLLFRVDGVETELGEWGYEAADAKLAKRPKPYFLVQLCFYSEQIARIQGAEPKRMHVVLGTREQRSFLVADFSAYYRRVRERFTEDLGGRPDTYPHPVEHCKVCRWRDHCDGQLVRDDHLSLVARIRRDQIGRLGESGIATVHELAQAEDEARPSRMPDASFEALRAQARLQAAHADTGNHSYELLAPEEGRGFALLPKPDEGDVFFDIEGDPFYDDDGLEYLHGVVFFEDGERRFEPFWSEDQVSEKRAFEKLIDWLVERRARYPGMHVYHYAPYEQTALKRLMGLHGTREQEVDVLLREGVLVDLYRVVRQAVRVSQPSYSIKKLEVFYRDGARDTTVTDGALATIQFEEWLETREQRLLDEIAVYNEDDCVSTWELREWLLGLRAEAENEFGAAIEARTVNDDAAELSEKLAEGRDEIVELQTRLCAGVPEDMGEATDDQRARWLLAQLLDFHWREAKPGYWDYYSRLEKSPEELVEDAEAIGELEPDGEPVPPEGRARLWTYRMRFPPQEHRLKPGKVNDPTSEASVEIRDLDNATGRLSIRHRPPAEGVPLPTALVPGKPYGTSDQRAALRRIGEHVADSGIDGPGSYRALRGLLLREPPRVVGLEPGDRLQAETFDLDEAKRIVLGLDASHLVIQGPPGSGKTWKAARLIVELMRSGKRVGVASTSHKAIHKLLEEVEGAAREVGFEFSGLKKSSSGNAESKYEGDFVKSADSGSAFPPPDEVLLVAGTAWLFAAESMDGHVDHLFVDEAGQVSLADALAMGAAAKNLVLLGDPQQLPHVSQAVHPTGTSCSVLEHLLGDEETVPPDRGLFLDRTWRMHPALSEFVSELMYEGRLGAVEECERQAIACPGRPAAGIVHVPVDHDGNSRSSEDEADRVAGIVGELLAGQWTRRDGSWTPMLPQDVMVVAPYNAQVRCLRDRLPDDVPVGTVDKFQGQEAAAVVYSLATSSGDDIPRNLEFLFSRNRLNVAISRARCLAFVVYSPRLLDAPARTVDQMRLINALCLLVETATEGFPATPQPATA